LITAWSVTIFGILAPRSPGCPADQARELREQITSSELVAGGASGWWYAKDRAREVSASADGASETSVPIRSGQQQGFFTGLDNPSDFTQTITGVATGPGVPASAPGSPNGGQVAVNAPNFNVDNGSSDFRGVRFVLPRPGAFCTGRAR
jgi:hypothetical protein